MKIDKIIKFSVIAMLSLIISFSVFYYFVIFLPKEQEQEFSFSMKQKCKTAGEKIYQEDKEGAKESKNLFIKVPEYTYNQRLNTCLYFGGYFKENFSEGWVKDSFTNKKIISFIEFEDNKSNRFTCLTCLSQEEFKEKKQELFNK